MTDVPDFRALEPFVDVACNAAYALTTAEAEPLFARAGMSLVGIFGSDADNSAIVSVADRADGERVFVPRGTQVIDGFSLTQCLDNMRVWPMRVPGVPGHFMVGYMEPLLRTWYRDLRPLLGQRNVICGHSLGGIHSLGACALTRFDRAVAVAPPTGMTHEAAAMVAGNCDDILIVGRRGDFALNHPAIIDAYVQPTKILHLLGGAEWEWRAANDWPWYDESVPDHSPDAYWADWQAMVKVA